MEINPLNKFNLNSELNKEQYFDDKEIKLTNIFSLIKRSKKKIFQITSIGFFLGLSISFAIEKRWSGFFEIMIANEPKAVTRVYGPVNFFPQNNNLSTEIEILKSPSVLLPVYNFLKEENNSNSEKLNQQGFKDWLESNVDVSLKKGTNILKISYEDKNKENIIPALNLISKTYQEYSREIKRGELKDELDFLNNQVQIYRVSSKEAYINLDRFARKHDLNPINPNDGIQYLDDEIRKLKSGNKIRRIDEQLKKLETSNNNDEFILEMAKLITPDIPVILELDNLQQVIRRLSLTFTENDSYLISLKKKESRLVLSLKEAVINSLKAQKRNALITINASKRPDDITTKYKLMALKTSQEFEVLKELEGKYRTLMQEKDKKTKPWQLIAKPYLMEYPVSPYRSRIVFAYTLFAFIFSLLFSFLLEKKSNIIFNESDIEEFLGIKKLLKVTNKDLKDDFQIINLLSNGILSDFKNNNIRIIDLTYSNKILIKKFFSKFQKEFKSSELVKSSSSISENIKMNIFLIEIGLTKFTEINEFLIRLNLNSDSKNLWIEI